MSFDPEDQADDDEIEPRDPAQELHEAACGFADRLGFDLCAAPDLPAHAPEAVRIHHAYHRLAHELGAVCSEPRGRHPA